MSSRAVGDAPSTEAVPPAPAVRWPLLALLVAFATASLWILAPARSGEFLSDDLPNVLYNPYVQELSAANLRAILDPGGEPAANTFNYAPVHMLALALEWRAFDGDVRGFHLVNALCHALAATLLVALLAARGLPLPGAAAAGALFLVHPANVEPAAWIFQIKTTGALALALGALLLHPRRPALGLLLFALGLLTKASAAFALPMAIAFTVLAPGAGAWRRHARWLLAWTALLIPFAWIELGVLGRASAGHLPLSPDPLVAARSVVALAGRYLAIAATGFGVAPSHDVRPALSPLDPWWLAGLLGLAALGLRALWALRGRREEAAWWIGAAAGYVPVGQIGMHFLEPMADRYLYFALPGLIGGVAFAARDAWRARVPSAAAAERMRHAALALAAVVIAALALRSHALARPWRSAATLALASASANPQGIAAQLLAAQRAALVGDAVETARALRAAFDRGYDRVDALAEAPVYDAVRADPAFQALVRDMAQAWVERSLTLAHPSQADLAARADAYLLLGDQPRAAEAIDAAIAAGGPLEASLRGKRARLRASAP